MPNSNEDRVSGMVDDAKGRGKMAVGDLTDNDQLRNEGAKDRVTGGVKQTVADAKDKLSDFADKLTDKSKDQ